MPSPLSLIDTAGSRLNILEFSSREKGVQENEWNLVV